MSLDLFKNALQRAWHNELHTNIEFDTAALANLNVIDLMNAINTSNTINSNIDNEQVVHVQNSNRENAIILDRTSNYFSIDQGHFQEIYFNPTTNNWRLVSLNNEAIEDNHFQLTFNEVNDQLDTAVVTDDYINIHAVQLTREKIFAIVNILNLYAHEQVDFLSTARQTDFEQSLNNHEIINEPALSDTTFVQLAPVPTQSIEAQNSSESLLDDEGSPLNRLLEKLNNYEISRNQYSTRQYILTGFSWFFGQSYSLNAKMDALNAFRDVLNRNFQGSREDFKRHEGALRYGNLGNALRSFVKGPNGEISDDARSILGDGQYNSPFRVRDFLAELAERRIVVNICNHEVNSTF